MSFTTHREQRFSSQSTLLHVVYAAAVCVLSCTTLSVTHGALAAPQSPLVFTALFSTLEQQAAYSASLPSLSIVSNTSQSLVFTFGRATSVAERFALEESLRSSLLQGSLHALYGMTELSVSAVAVPAAAARITPPSPLPAGLGTTESIVLTLTFAQDYYYLNSANQLLQWYEHGPQRDLYLQRLSTLLFGDAEAYKIRFDTRNAGPVPIDSGTSIGILTLPPDSIFATTPSPPLAEVFGVLRASLDAVQSAMPGCTNITVYGTGSGSSSSDGLPAMPSAMFSYTSVSKMADDGLYSYLLKKVAFLVVLVVLLLLFIGGSVGGHLYSKKVQRERDEALAGAVDFTALSRTGGGHSSAAASSSAFGGGAANSASSMTF